MAQRGLNKVMLIGRLGQDPNVRVMPQSGKPVANFSIATNESWKDRNTGDMNEKTEWHRCVAYDRLAEIFQDYVTKGMMVYVEGRLQTRKWQDQSGNDRYTTEIIVSEMRFLDGGSKNSPGSSYEPEEEETAPAPKPRQQTPAKTVSKNTGKAAGKTTTKAAGKSAGKAAKPPTGGEDIPF